MTNIAKIRSFLEKKPTKALSLARNRFFGDKKYFFAKFARKIKVWKFPDIWAFRLFECRINVLLMYSSVVLI